MAEDSEGLRAAVERTAQAVMTGNFAQLMADITPEAIAQLMTLAPVGSGLSLASMPAISGYDIRAVAPDGELPSFEVAFASSAGKVTLGATWKRVGAAWKIAGVRLAGFEPIAPPE